MSGTDRSVTWTFLTNHTHVLLCVANDREARVRDIAVSVGITERAVHRILVDLEAGGYISRERAGRRTRYKSIPNLPLRHPLESHCGVGELISLVQAPKRRKR